MKWSDCILVYGSTTKGDVVKRSDCILVYGSTTKGGVVKRSDCILVYGSTTKGDVAKRSDCTSLIYLNKYIVSTHLHHGPLIDLHHFWSQRERVRVDQIPTHIALTLLS